MDVDEEPQGGDPACWLDHVCPECGMFMEEGVPHSCPVGPATALGPRRPSDSAPG